MKQAESSIDVGAMPRPRLKLGSYRALRKIAMSNIIVNAGATIASASRPLFITTLLTLCLLACPCAWADTSAAQQTFDSPEAAVKVLVTAAEADDMNALRSILGSDAEPILSSGDPVADKNARDNFAAKYREMHRIAYDDQGRVMLYLGADNWPLPIPLIKKDGTWVFDTASGKAELLYRRIGQNELYTIGVLKEFVHAQEEYANETRDDDTEQFARKILSDPGTQDGLYWAVANGEPESPIGPLIASAVDEGYKRDRGGNATPFHGYYYRILTRQGVHAPGGAKNYLVNGKMTRGFAFLAVPAEYRSSGVMTFMINQDGIVVQKDLGANTNQIASEMIEFNPDNSWDQVIE
jgi:Protein of unknown function (DUF2950)